MYFNDDRLLSVTLKVRDARYLKPTGSKLTDRLDLTPLPRESVSGLLAFSLAVTSSGASSSIRAASPTQPGLLGGFGLGQQPHLSLQFLDTTLQCIPSEQIFTPHSALTYNLPELASAELYQSLQQVIPNAERVRHSRE